MITRERIEEIERELTEKDVWPYETEKEFLELLTLARKGLAAEGLKEALKRIDPALDECAKILRKQERISEKQRIAEHDACLIASGYLKASVIGEALARFEKECGK